jgi:hypothetical protein
VVFVKLVDLYVELNSVVTESIRINPFLDLIYSSYRLESAGTDDVINAIAKEGLETYLGSVSIDSVMRHSLYLRTYF